EAVQHVLENFFLSNATIEDWFYLISFSPKSSLGFDPSCSYLKFLEGNNSPCTAFPLRFCPSGTIGFATDPISRPSVTICISPVRLWQEFTTKWTTSPSTCSLPVTMSSLDWRITCRYFSNTRSEERRVGR